MSDDSDLILGTPAGDVPSVLPEALTELVGSAVRFVQTSTGMALDFTSETLPILDHYVRTARPELKERPEAAPLVAQSVGVYFGQVLAHELGAFWRASDPDAQRWLICCQNVYLAINPVGVGYDVVFEGERHDGPSAELLLAREDRESVEKRLAAMPEISADDYYSFSTRFDAVQIAVEGLRGEMLESGVEDVSFEWSDYEADFGDLG